MRNRARIGCISHNGGCASAISIAVIPDNDTIYMTRNDRRNEIPTKTPQVRSVVVGGVRILITGNHLGCHPVGSSDERVSDNYYVKTCHNDLSFYLLPIVLSNCAETPKSTNLTSALSVNNTFCPLISRCIT